MKDEKLVNFNAFRQRSLKNAADSLLAAENLFGKKINHIVYHLTLLSIEEVGQIFMHWMQINQKETWGKTNTKIELDDHETKLFYAIWGPSIGNELITQTQLNDHKAMAAKFHKRRMQVLYGVVDDIIECAGKMGDEEAQGIINFAKARLDLAKTEGEVNEESEPDTDFLWLHNYLKTPEKEKFVFGKTAQDKLIEVGGDSKEWIRWMRSMHEEEQQQLSELANKEINRVLPHENEEIKPKWEISFTVKTPSHSIRAKVLSAVNKKIDRPIKFYPGKDNHTLVIKSILGTNTSAADLWSAGWMSCQLFVASLNIAANGLFYWNMVTDVDRYYDSITDLVNKQKLLVRLETSLRLNWQEKRMYLNEQKLLLAFVVYEYLGMVESEEEGRPIQEYLTALGMLAKTDIHLRLESSIVVNFYRAFKQAVEYHQNLKDGDDFAEVGYEQIERMLKGKEQFDKTIRLARELIEGKVLSEPISLTEAIAMKNYCDIYFLTIAARKQHNDNSLRLTPITEEEAMEETD